MTKKLRSAFALDRYDDEKEVAECPGEDVCGKFKIAFRETGNGLDACVNCSLLPSKLAQIERKREALKAADEAEKHNLFFSGVFDARARARIQGEVDKSMITTLQFELLVYAEGLIEDFEREAAARARVAQEENNKLVIAIFKASSGVRFK